MHLRLMLLKKGNTDFFGTVNIYDQILYLPRVKLIIYGKRAAQFIVMLHSTLLLFLYNYNLKVDQ